MNLENLQNDIDDAQSNNLYIPLSILEAANLYLEAMKRAAHHQRLSGRPASGREILGNTSRCKYWLGEGLCPRCDHPGVNNAKT